MIVAELAAKLGLVPDEAAWEKGHSLVETLHHAMEAYLGYETIKKIGELTEGFVKSAIEAKHMGERLGISTEAVQELGYAAELSGSSAEGMKTSLQHLARGLNELQTKGTGPAATALQQLGIKFSELKGESLDKNLEVIANRFAKLPDGAKKTALAMELFGRSGTELIPLLNRGQAGIAELRNEAEKMGVVIGEEGVKKAEEFERAQKRLGATLTGLRNTFAEALLPTLQEAAESLQAWVMENREAIASTLKQIVEGIATAFHYVSEAISEATHFIKEHQGVFEAALIALGIVLAAFAIQAAISWALAFWPVTLAIAIIAALALGIKKLAEYITGQEMSWSQLWDEIVREGNEVVDWFEALPGKIEDFFVGIKDSIINAFKSAWEYVVSSAKQAWEDIKDIPVIGHIIKGVGYVGGKVSDLLSSGGTVGDIARGMTGGGALNMNPALAGGGSVTIGDTNIHIHNAQGLDEEKVADLAAKKAREVHEDAIRQAHSNLGGGKRGGG